MEQKERERDTCSECNFFHPGVKTHRGQGSMKMSGAHMEANAQKQARNAQNRAARAELQRQGKI